jgi:hypothetical protein
MDPLIHLPSTSCGHLEHSSSVQQQFGDDKKDLILKKK